MKKLEQKLTQLASLENVEVNTEAEHNGEKVKDHFCAHLPYIIKGHELALAAVPNLYGKLIIRLAMIIFKAIGNQICVPKEEAKG